MQRRKCLPLLVVILLTPMILIGQGYPLIKNFEIDETLDSFQNWDMVQDTNGYIFVGYSSGISLFDGNKWESKHVPNAQHVHSLLLSKSGIVYYGSENELGFIDRDELNGFKPVSLKNKLPDSTRTIGDIWNIYELDDDIYFQISEGFIVWDQKEFSIIKLDGILINSFFIEGKIIAQVQGKGLASISQKEVVPFNKYPYLNTVDKFIYGLIPFDGYLIAGVREIGLVKLNGSSHTIISTAENSFNLKDKTVYRALKIDDHRIALTTQDFGILIFSKIGKYLFSIDEGSVLDVNRINSNTVYKLVFDSEGELWALLFGGISKIDINAAVTVYEEKSNIKGEISDIKVSDNKLYVKTTVGTYVKRTGTRFFESLERDFNWDSAQIKEGQNRTFSNLPKIEYTGFIDDTLRIGTASGLYKVIKEGESPVIDTSFLEEEIESGQVFRFHQDQEGDVWFRVERKIQLYTKNQDGKYEESKIKIPEITKNDVIYNMASSENKVWFSGYNRIFELDKTKLKPYSNNFKTNITEVFINRDSLIYAGLTKLKRPPTLEYKNNELRFAFSAASYKNPERNEYQVVLEGFDETWSNWSLETQKDYTNIPEGTYTFKVKSKNVYETEGTMDEFTFTILPPWYRTWWAYTLYLVTFCGLLYLGYKIRINQILQVQRVRNRIADDLHDDLSGTLIGISNFAKAISSNPHEKNKTRFLSLIEKSADEAKEKISDIVWTINPEHDDWMAFLAKCRRYASDSFEAQKMDYALEMDENIPGDLSMELRKNLWLIFKEILTNITKHSNADYVLVRFNIDSKRLSILIKDNGKGFDLENCKKGNGIHSIKKRIQSLNGEADLVSGIDQGTSWNIKVNI